MFRLNLGKILSSVVASPCPAAYKRPARTPCANTAAAWGKRHYFSTKDSAGFVAVSKGSAINQKRQCLHSPWGRRGESLVGWWPMAVVKLAISWRNVVVLYLSLLHKACRLLDQLPPKPTLRTLAAWCYLSPTFCLATLCQAVWSSSPP